MGTVESELHHEQIRWAWQLPGGWHGPFTITPASSHFGFDVDTFGRPNVAYLDGEFLAAVRTRNGWKSRFVAPAGPFAEVVVRRAFHAHVVLAWAAHSGLWVARN